jgi:serine/threonine protein kinase
MDLSHRLPEISAALSERGYEVLGALGSGRFAQAFEVHSKKYNDRFCAKILDNSSSQHDDLKSVYHTEIESLVSLTHPNIITVFDTFEFGDLLCLILEYAENGSLQQKLSEVSSIAVHKLAPIARQMIEALAYCHAEGFSHGDIKPANILLDKYGRPKLADFGLAARYIRGENPKQCGSPSYMAPELLAGRARDPFACDVWALGVTLYELAVGTRPFKSGTSKALLQEIALSRLEFPATVPASLREAIAQMLSFDPRVRPTMAQLIQMPFFMSLKLRPNRLSSLTLSFTGPTPRRLARVRNASNDLPPPL